MEKIYLPDVDRYEISCTKEYYLHEIGSEDYPEIRKARVKAVDVDRWEEIAVDAVPRYIKAQYDAEVERLIAERYSHGKEIEINREATTKPERFAEYLEYIEECKRRAKELLMEKGGETDDTRS